MKTITDNPFAQPEALVEVMFDSTREQAQMIELAFEDLAFSHSRFEVQEDIDEWRTRMLFDTRDKAEVLERIERLGQAFDQAFAPPKISSVGDVDWVSKVQESFKPVRAGRFYVYGSHIHTPPPQGTIPIRMNAGAAFGTGEHETTSGCLIALDELSKRHRFSCPLDMGCGSAILAIGAAKLWRVPVVGVDIDKVSIDVARDNIRLNRVAHLVQAYCGNGYQAKEVQGMYDLIIANILARPLMMMARPLRHHLSDGGMVVLSGLLTRQEPMVLWAHRVQGLKLVKRIHVGQWSTLILKA